MSPLRLRRTKPDMQWNIEGVGGRRANIFHLPGANPDYLKTQATKNNVFTDYLRIGFEPFSPSGLTQNHNQCSPGFIFVLGKGAPQFKWKAGEPYQVRPAIHRSD